MTPKTNTLLGPGDDVDEDLGQDVQQDRAADSTCPYCGEYLPHLTLEAATRCAARSLTKGGVR